MRNCRLILLSIAALLAGSAGAGDPSPSLRIALPAPPTPLPLQGTRDTDQPLPINLPTALSLAGARPLDVSLASERIRVASAQLQRARVTWLPTLYLGADYFRHDGQIQDVAGNILGTSKSTFMAGGGPVAVFAVTDAIFAPLAARQDLRARESLLQVTQNDSVLAVAEAYFGVQQARGELAGAVDAAQRAEDVLKKAEQHVPSGLVPPVEVVRTRVEASRRRQAVHAARERWRLASAELARILRLQPSALVEPLEPPHLLVTLISSECPVDELIATALINRPELAAQQALVQATLQRLRQERLRPLIPSVLLRGAATNPAGLMGVGVFGGGRNGRIADFSARSDMDIELLWELQNLGFGNRAQVNARRAERELALLELFRIQDRIAAEVAQAHAQVQSASARLVETEVAVKDAVDSFDKNVEGLKGTQGGAGKLVLLIRPQEVVAALQALAQAYADYYATVADYSRAQFRLYRALGHPAQLLTAQPPDALLPEHAPVGDAPSKPSRVRILGVSPCVE